MNEESFKVLVEQYCTLDVQEKELAKQKSQLRDTICAYMEENQMNKAVIDGYSLSYSVTSRTTVNQDRLVDIVKGWNCSEDGLIKTREYVDEDVLESVVYNGLVTDDQVRELDKCRSVKEVKTLRPNRRKGG